MNISKTKRIYWWIIFLLFLVVNIFERLNHRYLFIGWENDWIDYAERARNFGSVFSFDGFRCFGFPLLIKLFSYITKDILSAGTLVVSVAGLIFLAGVFQLANIFLPVGYAFLATIFCLFNWHFAIHTVLLAGTDILFASATIWAFVAIAIFIRTLHPKYAAISGALAGLGYIMRYTGIILPFVVMVFYFIAGVKNKDNFKKYLRPLFLFIVFFVLVGAPQFIINWTGGGSPLANYQTKNIYIGITQHFQSSRTNKEEIPNNISINDILALGIPKIIAHIIKEFAKSCARIVAMSLGIDFKTAKYFIPKPITISATLLVLIAITILFSLARIDIRKPFKTNKTFVIFISLFFLIYTLSISTIFSSNRFFIFFVPLVYIFTLASLEPSKTKGIWRKLCSTAFILSLAINLIFTTSGFKKGYSFPVESVLSSMTSDGDILSYGTYYHLHLYTTRKVERIKQNSTASEILNMFTNGSYRYLVITKNLPFTWEYPNMYDPELENLQPYGFRLLMRLDSPRQIFVWEKYEYEGQ